MLKKIALLFLFSSMLISLLIADEEHGHVDVSTMKGLYAKAINKDGSIDSLYFAINFEDALGIWKVIPKDISPVGFELINHIKEEDPEQARYFTKNYYKIYRPIPNKMAFINETNINDDSLIFNPKRATYPEFVLTDEMHNFKKSDFSSITILGWNNGLVSSHGINSIDREAYELLKQNNQIKFYVILEESDRSLSIFSNNTNNLVELSLVDFYKALITQSSDRLNSKEFKQFLVNHPKLSKFIGTNYDFKDKYRWHKLNNLVREEYKNRGIYLVWWEWKGFIGDF